MTYTAHDAVEHLPYLMHAEVDALQELARSLLDSPVVVNIGAGSGVSGLAFMEARPDLTLYTVDIQDASSPFGCLEGERNTLKKAGYENSPRHRQIQGDSKVVGLTWTHGPVDMVFIDGDHSYEGCTRDIEVWLPNVKPGGVIAVHDYDKPRAFARLKEGEAAPHPHPWPGVDRAVAELLLPNYDMVAYVDTLIAFRVNE